MLGPYYFSEPGIQALPLKSCTGRRKVAGIHVKLLLNWTRKIKSIFAT